MGYAESEAPYRLGHVERYEDEVMVGDPLVIGSLAAEVRAVFDRAARATRQMNNDASPPGWRAVVDPLDQGVRAHCYSLMRAT